MRSIVRSLLAIAGGMLVAQCHEDSLTAPRPITAVPRTRSAAETGLISADNRFAFSLFGETAGHTSPDSNLFISPLSAAMALAMAYNGAAGATQAEMRQVLQLESLTLDDVDQSYRSLIGLLRGLDPQVAFTLANSVWYDLDPRYAPTPDFLATTRTYFDARVESLDFKSPSAAPKINAWVSDQTHGKIPTIVPDPVPRDAVAYLINAIYFKGSWTAQFDKGLTQPGTFRLTSGAAATVPMMKHGRTVPIGIASVNGVTVLDLPYGGDAFSMTLALPQDARGIDSLVQGLTSERWTSWVAALDSAALEVLLPKFSLTYALT